MNNRLISHKFIVIYVLNDNLAWHPRILNF